MTSSHVSLWIEPGLCLFLTRLVSNHVFLNKYLKHIFLSGIQMTVWAFFHYACLKYVTKFFPCNILGVHNCNQFLLIQYHIHVYFKYKNIILFVMFSIRFMLCNDHYFTLLYLNIYLTINKDNNLHRENFFFLKKETFYGTRQELISNVLYLITIVG